MIARDFFESVCGPVRWRGDEGSAHCPLPSHGGRDKHPSFSVNSAQGTFYCHKEKIGGGLKQLAEMTGRTPFAGSPPLMIIRTPLAGCFIKRCDFRPKDLRNGDRTPTGRAAGCGI